MADTPIIGPSLRKRRSDNTGSYEVDGIEFASGEVTLVQDFHGSAGNVKIGMGAPTSRLVVSGTIGTTSSVDLIDVYEYVTTVSGDIISSVRRVSDEVGGILYLPPYFMNTNEIEAVGLDSSSAFIYLTAPTDYLVTSVAIYIHDDVTDGTLNVSNFLKNTTESFPITTTSGWYQVTLSNPIPVSNKYPAVLNINADSDTVKMGVSLPYEGLGKSGPHDCDTSTNNGKTPMFIINPGSDDLPQIHFLPFTHDQVPIYDLANDTWSNVTIPASGLRLPSSSIPDSALLWDYMGNEQSIFEVCIDSGGDLTLRDYYYDYYYGILTDSENRAVTTDTGEHLLGYVVVNKSINHFVEASNTITITNWYNRVDKFIASYRSSAVDSVAITGNNTWEIIPSMIWLPQYFFLEYSYQCNVITTSGTENYVMVRGLDSDSTGPGQYMQSWMGGVYEGIAKGGGILQSSAKAKGTYTGATGFLGYAWPGIKTPTPQDVYLYDGVAWSGICASVKI